MIDETSICEETWWSNLLYINNFYPADYKKQCVPWAWYLADDMQFFIVGMIILSLYRLNKVTSSTRLMYIPLHTPTPFSNVVLPSLCGTSVAHLLSQNPPPPPSPSQLPRPSAGFSASPSSS